MAKSLHIFIISLIVLSVAESRVMRPDSDPHKSVHNPSSKSHIAASPEQTRNNDFDDHFCKGLSREECLVRKTLLAHTDYIYTEDTNGP